MPYSCWFEFSFTGIGFNNRQNPLSLEVGSHDLDGLDIIFTVEPPQGITGYIYMDKNEDGDWDPGEGLNNLEYLTYENGYNWTMNDPNSNQPGYFSLQVDGSLTKLPIFIQLPDWRFIEHELRLDLDGNDYDGGCFTYECPVDYQY